MADTGTDEPVEADDALVAGPLARRAGDFGPQDWRPHGEGISPVGRSVGLVEELWRPHFLFCVLGANPMVC